MDIVRLERRSSIGTLIKSGVTHYYLEVFDVEVNETANTEEEIWRSDPEIFWNMTKPEVIALLQRRIQPSTNADVINNAINQLESA